MALKSLKVTRIFRAFVSIIRSNVWILDGCEASTNDHLKIIYAGSNTQKNYIAYMAFNSNYKELYLGKKYVWHLYYSISKNIYHCSLAVIEGGFLHRFMYERMKDFYIPIWLKSRVDIPLRVTNSSSKEDVRKIRKNRLEYIITKAPDQLDEFYYNMYLPSVKKSHQERAIVMEYSAVMQKVREGRCELLLINRQGLSIAGILIVTGESMPRLWSAGIREGNPTFSKEGAKAATYYFSSQYLAQLGYKEMHMGLLRSFLCDGVLQYKKKWNIRVETADTEGFIFKPLNLSNGLKGFFINNPFVCNFKNQLSGTVFVSDDKHCSHEDFKQFRTTYYLAGLSELNVCRFDKANGKVHKILDNNCKSR